MKRLAYILSAIALSSFVFASCKDNGGVDLNTVTEDGFYVAGAATGIDGLPGKLQMGTGANEKEKAYRDGMFEKYVVLQAGKDFELLLYEAGKRTRYSAVLEDYTPDPSTEAYAQNPTFTIQRGELQTGDSAPAMQVKKDGMYHIVLDLNTKGDLSAAQIIVVPIESWYYRGAITALMNPPYIVPTSVDKKSNEEIVYTFKDLSLLPTNWFKFVYSDAWKITLDVQGKVKAETTLGTDADDNTKISQKVASGDAGNIYVKEAGIYDIVLTYKLAGGRVSNTFSYTATKTADYILNPAEFVVGLSGSDVECGWGDPAGTCKGVFDAAKSKVNDDAKKTGNYVFNLTGVEMSGEFKIRINGDWVGVSGATVTGITTSGTDNFVVGQNGVYDAVLSFDWDGEKYTNVKMVFTRKGDLVKNPATFAVGLSGANIKDANGKNWADYLLAGTYNATESKVTNTTNKAGTYVWDIKDAKFNGAFKVRCEGSWWGYGEVEVSGVTATDSEGNLNIAEEATYDIKITLTWDGENMTTKKIAFTKK
jgi:hypothetical protein